MSNILELFWTEQYPGKNTLIKSKTNKDMGILRNLRYFIQENVLRNLFNAFIKPYLDYGNLVWRSPAMTYLPKLRSAIYSSMSHGF